MWRLVLGPHSNCMDVPSYCTGPKRGSPLRPYFQNTTIAITKQSRFLPLFIKSKVHVWIEKWTSFSYGSWSMYNNFRWIFQISFEQINENISFSLIGDNWYWTITLTLLVFRSCLWAIINLSCLLWHCWEVNPNSLHMNWKWFFFFVNRLSCLKRYLIK